MHIPQHLYDRILRSLPIPCVDLVVVDPAGRVLLLRRVNEPQANAWWLPGGRVHYCEMRAAAAERKLREECGLTPAELRELGTFDLVLPFADGHTHAVTTVFRVDVANPDGLRLDAQSSAAEWRAPGDWSREALHPFVHDALAKAFRQEGQA